MSKIGQEIKKVDVISKMAKKFLVFKQFLVIPVDVPSFKLIEGQTKE